MAGIRHTYQTSIKDDAGRTVASESSIQTGDTEIEFSTTVPGSGNDVVTFEVDVSSVIAFYIVSDKEVTMTENDDGSPDLTQVLSAGVPFWWYTGKGSNPFSVDIASLKFTKADATSAVVHGAFLVVA
jgi:hypothetical protein